MKAAKSSSKVADKNVVIRTATLNQEPLNSTRSLKQSATFEDNRKNSTFKNIDIASAKTPIRLSMSQKEMTKGTTTTTNHVVVNSKANIWENEEMKKIKERYEVVLNFCMIEIGKHKLLSSNYKEIFRYEKQHYVILDWETKKKKKSKRHLEQIEVDSNFSFLI